MNEIYCWSVKANQASNKSNFAGFAPVKSDPEAMDAGIDSSSRVDWLRISGRVDEQTLKSVACHHGDDPMQSFPAAIKAYKLI